MNGQLHARQATTALPGNPDACRQLCPVQSWCSAAEADPGAGYPPPGCRAAHRRPADAAAPRLISGRTDTSRNHCPDPAAAGAGAADRYAHPPAAECRPADKSMVAPPADHPRSAPCRAVPADDRQNQSRPPALAGDAGAARIIRRPPAVRPVPPRILHTRVVGASLPPIPRPAVTRLPIILRRPPTITLARTHPQSPAKPPPRPNPFQAVVVRPRPALPWSRYFVTVKTNPLGAGSRTAPSLSAFRRGRSGYAPRSWSKPRPPWPFCSGPSFRIR